MLINPGLYSEKIKIQSIKNIVDDDGFTSENITDVAEVYAYFEPKHGSEKWVNRTQLFEATGLFRFRLISNIPINEKMIILYKNQRYEITSVDDTSKAYVEVMVKIIK